MSDRLDDKQEQAFEAWWQNWRQQNGWPNTQRMRDAGRSVYEALAFSNIDAAVENLARAGHLESAPSAEANIEHPAGNRTNAGDGARAPSQPREVGRTPTRSSGAISKGRDDWDRAEGSGGRVDTANAEIERPDAATRSAPSHALHSEPTEAMVEAGARRMAELVRQGIIEKPPLTEWQPWAGSVRAVLEASLRCANSATVGSEDDGLSVIQNDVGFIVKAANGKELFLTNERVQSLSARAPSVTGDSK